MNTVVIVLVGLGIGFALKLFRNYVSMQLYHRDILDKHYVCPNCGHKFYPNWFQLSFNTFRAYTWDSASLRCPACHKKDMCHISHEDK